MRMRIRMIEVDKNIYNWILLTQTIEVQRFCTIHFWKMWKYPCLIHSSVLLSHLFQPLVLVYLHSIIFPQSCLISEFRRKKKKILQINHKWYWYYVSWLVYVSTSTWMIDSSQYAFTLPLQSPLPLNL